MEATTIFLGFFVVLVLLCSVGIAKFVRMHKRLQDAEDCAYIAMNTIFSMLRKNDEIMRQGVKYLKVKDHHPQTCFLEMEFRRYQVFESVEELLDNGEAREALKIIFLHQDIWRHDPVFQLPLTPRQECLLRESVEAGAQMLGLEAQQHCAHSLYASEISDELMEMMTFVERYAEERKITIPHLSDYASAVRTLKLEIDFARAQMMVELGEDNVSLAVHMDTVRGIIEWVRTYAQEHRVSLPKRFEEFATSVEAVPLEWRQRAERMLLEP